MNNTCVHYSACHYYNLCSQLAHTQIHLDSTCKAKRDIRINKTVTPVTYSDANQTSFSLPILIHKGLNEFTFSILHEVSAKPALGH